MARSYKRDANGRFAGSGGGGKKKSSGGSSTPKTTSARGRAQANERKASKALKAANKSGQVGRKEARSLLTAQRAREFYQRSGTGTKRSPSKASGGSKPAKASVAKRKAEMNKSVTAAALMGKGPRNKQRERYIGSQNQAAAQASSGRGKGSKAARRAASLRR